MNRKSLVAGALTLATLALTAPTAHADPKPPDLSVLTLTCDGEDYDIVANGNGLWTPAHDLNSTLIGVPIEFGEFNGVFTPADGGDPEPFTEPPFAKPNRPKTRNLIIDCSYTVTGQFEDGSFTGSGPVTIMVPRIH